MIIIKNKEYLIWLSSIEIGEKRLNLLLNKFGTLEEIWKAKKQQLIKIEGIGDILAEKIVNKKSKEQVKEYIEQMKKEQIFAITIEDKEYPNKLKNIYDKPLVIYVKGEKSILDKFSLAVVGCRECSDYGENVSKNIGYSLAKHNIIVISGMARGIDSHSHMGCIKGNGKTIAVLGNGVDYIYPKENNRIYNEILETGGAIVSEYIVGKEPSRMKFPARNRIISGLSNGLIVVEARKKSGTLITVDFALEQGKNVFTIPR